MEVLLTEAGETLDEGNYEKALFAYQEAARSDPRSATAYDGIAQCQYRLRNYDEALRAAKIASGLDPNLISPHLIQAYL